MKNERLKNIDDLASTKTSIVDNSGEIGQTITLDPKLELKSRIVQIYVPAIQELFAQKTSREILSGGAGKGVGQAAYKLVLKKSENLNKENFKEDIDFALVNLGEDIFPDEKGDEDSFFLIKYLTFFLSLQNYLGLKERREERVTRLSSPPPEAYEKVGHNKLDFKESPGSSALLFED